MTDLAPEFIRRFLLHVPIPKFVRIRHYRFLANGQKKQTLAQCRELLREVFKLSGWKPYGTPNYYATKTKPTG